MQYFSYLSEDIYTYENLDELKKILEFDQIGETKINETEQYIQYYINREKCIRLSDLVYFISFNLCRIHLGQLLVLVKSLLIKVQQLQEANIEHEYLDCNRIWLKFHDSNQTFNNKYEILNYTIHFTGYQCPNYEDLNEKENYQIKSSKKIQLIIKYIIDNYFDKIILKQTQDINKEDVKKNILEPILQEINNKKLDQLINEINDILEKYSYQKDKQIISVDEYFDTLFYYRHDSKIKYSHDIKQIMQTIPIDNKTPQDAFILEYCLFQNIPSIVQQLECRQQYKRIDYNGEKFKKDIEQIQSNIQTKIQNYIEVQVKQAMQVLNQNFSYFQKYELDLEEAKEILTTILSNHAIIKYFYNTYTHIFKYTLISNIGNQDAYNSNKNKLYEAMQKAIQKMINLYVEEYCNLKNQIKILDLINDLI